MYTGKVDSGPPRAGKADVLESLVSPVKSKTEAAHQGPESFAKVMEAKKSPVTRAETKNSSEPKKSEDRAPLENTTEGGKKEVGSRTSDHLTVKQDRRKEPVSTEKQETAQAVPVGKRNSVKKAQGPESEHAAMQEFMDSMESEFGIPPTQIVAAMAELDAQDLVRLPEDTASQVIKNLELPPGDQEKAMALYMGMLQKISPDVPVAKQEALYAPPVVLNVVQGKTLNAEAINSVGPGLNPEQAQLLKLMKAAKAGDPEALTAIANRLNQTIESDLHTLQQVLQKLEQAQPVGQGEEAPAELLASLAAMDVAVKNLEGQNPNQLPKSTELQMQSPEMRAAMASVSGATMVNPQVATAGYQDMAAANAATPTGAQGISAVLQSKAFVPPTLGPAASAASSGSAATSAASAASAQDLAASQLIIGGGKSASDARQGSAGSDSDAKDSSKQDADPQAQKLGNEFFVDNRQPLKAEAGLKTMNTVHSPEMARNLEQVNNQAQIMVRQGGGEAIVKMNPEGLGEVHLKVTVADGKVNVQMSTTSREARDLLESSMKDLKASLGAHNLKIDHMKVDVGNQASADAGGQSQSRQMDMDQGREQARQFLQNFAEENAANRNPFHRPELSRAYSSKTGASSARNIATPAVSGRYVGEGRGSGLNLVA